MTRLLAVLLAPLALSGCGQPTHLQYDHGRAFNAAFEAQSDLTRPSVAKLQVGLTGEEGLRLRQVVIESTTDEESGEAEAVE